MCFSAAASSENDQGSMNLASKTAPVPATCRRGSRPSTGARDAGPDAGRHSTVCPVLRSYQCRLRGFGHQAELDDEVAGQVLRLDLASFLPPEPEQGGFVAAHDDPGVGAADEGGAALGILRQRDCVSFPAHPK